MIEEKKTKKQSRVKRFLKWCLKNWAIILGSLALALSLAYAIKGCSSKAKSNAVNASFLSNDRLGLAGEGPSIGSQVKPFDAVPMSSSVLTYDDNGDLYNKLITSYLSITLTYEGTDTTTNSSIYSFSNITIDCKVTGDGLTYYDLSYTPTMGSAVLSEDGWLVLMIYADDLNAIYGKCAFSNVNYTRQSVDGSIGYADSYLYNTQTSPVGHMEDFDDFLTSHCNNSGYVDDLDFRQYFYFFQIEMVRLIDRADAYGFGYMQGYLNGISWVRENAHDYDLFYQYDLDDAYDRGYAQGTLDAQGASIPTLIYTVLNAPMLVLNGAFNFEIFGINVANVLKFLLTVSCVVFVVRTFKGH